MNSLLLFLSIGSNVYSPITNENYYVNNDINVSWDSNLISSSDVNLILLHNNYIVKYSK